MHVIYLLRFEWEFILIINCARYSVTFIMIEYIIYICKVVYFCQMIDVFFRLYNPFPP